MGVCRVYSESSFKGLFRCVCVSGGGLRQKKLLGRHEFWVFGFGPVWAGFWVLSGPKPPNAGLLDISEMTWAIQKRFSSRQRTNQGLSEYFASICLKVRQCWVNFRRKMTYGSQNQCLRAGAKTVSLTFVGQFATKFDPMLPHFQTNWGKIFWKPLVCTMTWAKKLLDCSRHLRYIYQAIWVVLALKALKIRPKTKLKPKIPNVHFGICDENSPNIALLSDKLRQSILKALDLSFDVS